MIGYAESVASRNTVLSGLREMAAGAHRRGGRASVAVAISLGDRSQPPRFYTTHDRIEGHVSFTALADTHFDRLSIVFEGVLFCRSPVLCCAVLCCAVLCCAVLCCAVLRCAVLC